MSAEQALALLDSIDTSHVVGLRDRTLIAVTVYSFARIIAVVGMRVEDYYHNGAGWWIRLHEKGGKFYEVPAHHNAEAYLDASIRATGIPAYLDNGGTIENAQAIAAHESPRTTKLYDRTGDEITLDELERILL